MLFVETVNRPRAVQVNAADHFLKNSERDTEQRAHMGLGYMSWGQALWLRHGPEAGHIGTQNGYSLLHHLAGDRAANPHQRRFPRTPGSSVQRTEFLLASVGQQDRAASRGHHFENQTKPLSLQCLEILDGMHHAADL